MARTVDRQGPRARQWPRTNGQGNLANQRRQGPDGGRTAPRRRASVPTRVHADLHRGEKAVRVILQAEDRAGARASPPPASCCTAAPPGGDHGDLGGGEEAVDQDEDADKSHLQPERDEGGFIP